TTRADPGPEKTAVTASLTAVLAQILSARSITIDDYWLGYSVIERTDAHYSLIRNIDSYSGMAQFSARGYGGPQPDQSATASITIPVGVAKDFLKQLANAPLEAGEYKPEINQTDSYPALSIELQVSNQIVRFYSQSQGADYAPWGADISGQKYTINSGI